MDTIDVTVTIPTSWLEGNILSHEELRQALKLGFDRLRQQQHDDNIEVVRVLLGTGRSKHLAGPLHQKDTIEEPFHRQPAPTLSGSPLSDILIAQRRGEQ